MSTDRRRRPPANPAVASDGGGGGSDCDIIVTGTLPTEPGQQPLPASLQGGAGPNASIRGTGNTTELPECPDRPIDAAAAATCQVTVTARRKSVLIAILVSGLDSLANLVGPGEVKLSGETFQQCFSRITGGGRTFAKAGASIGAGANVLPYPRGVPPGGSGTSIISTTSRAIFGNVPRMGGFKAMGTNSFGGAVGRISSATAVWYGSEQFGRAAGAVQVCK